MLPYPYIVDTDFYRQLIIYLEQLDDLAKI